MDRIPEYYQGENGTDVIDFIESSQGVQAAKEFCRGSVIKYVTRYDKKNGVEDLHKAQTFIARLMKFEGVSGRTITNFIPAVNGIREVNDTTLYQCAYSCGCGAKGKRFVKEDAEKTTCHKCDQELKINPSTENDAHDKDFNYFLAN